MAVYEVNCRKSMKSLDRKDQLSLVEIQSFQNGQFNTLILKPGKILWRFYSQKKHRLFSNCWVDQGSMNYLMSIFHTTRRFDIPYKQQVIQDNLAILSDWSYVQYRVKIQISGEIIAHKGIIASQRKFGSVSVHNPIKKPFPGIQEQMVEQRLGSLVQYVIPRLRDRSLNQMRNPYARVIYRARI